MLPTDHITPPESTKLSTPKSPSSHPKRRQRKKTPQNRQRLRGGRIILVWLLLMLGCTGLGIRLHWLQMVSAEDLTERAKQQQMVYMRPYIPRRTIIDRNGNILATDRLVYTLYAHPTLFKQKPEEVAEQLAPLVQQEPGKMVKKFNSRESGIALSHKLSEELADRIRALQIDGLELIRQYARLYPQQELVAEVVGYVDVDHKGQAGLEYSQEELLERDVRTLYMSRTGNGVLMPDHLPEGFLGFDQQQLQLTIDMRLQRVARSLLKERLAKYNARRGAVIVMDVNDGSLLALVCEPTFDPNEYSQFDIGLFKNWAVTDLYEPGSTFKPINIAIALEQGAIQADQTFLDQGRLEIDTWEITNHDYRTVGARGRLNLGQVLTYSSNVAMVEVVRSMSPQTYYDSLIELGLKENVKIELPSSAAGQLKSEDQFLSSPVESATTAFGQGFSLTPLKLAQLHAAIANGGILVTPHVMTGLMDSQTETYQAPLDYPVKRVFSPENTQAVLSQMGQVMDASSGQPAQVPGYRMAGKSGTAEKANPSGRGYSKHKKVVSFVATLPRENPQYVVLAVIDEPQGKALFGSTVAAPLVKSVTEALIAIEGLPPSDL